MGSAAEAYLEGKKYYPYYGRGFIQLTHKRNYDFYGNLLRIDLVNERDKALEPEIALFIAIDGLRRGKFGHKLADHINAETCDFRNARRCVNGTDRADDIAEIAERYRRQLEA